MSERRPFREVKLQWLEQLSCDAGLSDSAKCVALHIITRYVNGHTEEAWPSYQTIADAIGKSVKTIQRAIHDLELGGWFDVVRRNGIGRSTRYRPSEASILQACEAREKTDKIVTLHPQKGGQNCLKRRSNVSSKGGQNCHPNLENLNNKKLKAREDSSPQAEVRRAVPALFVAEFENLKLDQWREWLVENKLLDLELIARRDCRKGHQGFTLPSMYPPNPDDIERNRDYLEYFKIRQQIAQQACPSSQRLAS